MSTQLQTRNRILQKLAPADMNAILSDMMELVELEIRDMIYEANQPIESAYFPENGIVSIVTPLEDGSAVEAATIGNEGMIGVPLLLQATPDITNFLITLGTILIQNIASLKSQSCRARNDYPVATFMDCARILNMTVTELLELATADHQLVVLASPGKDKETQ